jgi:prepilin-type processing-associated H-X9-DG protein/prepilin-type N-terminal cleavage/methylation domain-containing protein
MSRIARPHRQPSRAYSLLELLVVVAVIATLAALLTASVSTAKRGAQRARCIANLRQLGLAGQLYWDDHAGRSFRYRREATNGGDVFWFGWLQRGREGERAFRREAGALDPYLASRPVSTCPTLNYAMPRFKLKAAGAAFGYGYNLWLSPADESSAISIPNLTTPAGVAFLADAAQINTFQTPATPEHPLLEEFYYITTNEPTTHFRHSRHANVVFCDGHVNSEHPAAIGIDRRLPPHVLGVLPRDRIVGSSEIPQ